jgi:hypothetical protein
MSNNLADQPAFPTIESVNHGNMIEVRTKHDGLTLRQYYAGRNMAALIKGFIPIESKYSVNDGYMDFDDMAVDALKAADALIKELSKPITDK